MAEEEAKPVKRIVEATEDIIETYRSLIALTLVEYSSLGAGIGIAGIVFLVFVVFCLLFVGLGAAWWIGESMNNMKAGFFLISAVYAIVLIVLAVIARKKFIGFIRDLIIKGVYDKD